MRPQLLVGGLLVTGMGVGFYILQIPLVFFWSLPFAVAGVLMVVASFFVSASPGPIQPPEGFRFCPFCSTPVQIGAERCPHCDGLQRSEG